MAHGNQGKTSQFPLHITKFANKLFCWKRSFLYREHQTGVKTSAKLCNSEQTRTGELLEVIYYFATQYIRHNKKQDTVRKA